MQKVSWVNPHAYVFVDVKDESGKVTTWAFESLSPNALARQGWTRNSLKIGEAVTVEGPLYLKRQSGANGAVSNDVHNTLSAVTEPVRVCYPFHPLHGLSLQVIRKSQRGDGAVSIRDPAGKRLKIPVWMLSPDASHVQIVARPLLCKEALLSLTSLIAPQLDITNHNLSQTRVPRDYRASVRPYQLVS